MQWIVAFTALCMSIHALASPIVSLPSGAKVLGKYKYGLPAYLGLRYAKAPRFEVPQLWDIPPGEVTNATAIGPWCLQVQQEGPGLIGAEDCTFLNILTPLPKVATKEKGEKKAVMFWIHGGCFQLGSGVQFGLFPNLVKEGDVVVVTINYRLGPFGFFTPSSDAAPKNYGLRDQIVALQWVQKYIAYFGGDPGSVTIFGESAGGQSVMALYHAPMAADFFHRAISQSPGFQTPGQLTRPWREAAAGLSAACMAKSKCDTVECMRKKPAAELALDCIGMMRCGSFYLNEPGAIFSGFDGEVVQQPMFQGSCERQRASSADKPLMIGGTVHEWRLFNAWRQQIHQTALQMNDSHYGDYPGRYDHRGIEVNFFREYLQGYASSPPKVQECARRKVYDMFKDATGKCTYCGNFVSKDAPMIDMLSAIVFSVATQIYALEPGGPRYRYLLDMGEDSSTDGLGTTHTVDINYLTTPEDTAFPKTCSLSKDVCLRTAKMMRGYWASFAKTGVPTTAGGPTWMPVDPSGGFSALPFLKLGPHMEMSDTAWFNNESSTVLSAMVCKKLELQGSDDGTQCEFKPGHQQWPVNDASDISYESESSGGHQTTIVVAISGILVVSAMISFWQKSMRVKTQRTSIAEYRLLNM